MQKIKITNKVLEQKIKEYARKHKISFQKACAKLFDKGVCHLQKKTLNQMCLFRQNPEIHFVWVCATQDDKHKNRGGVDGQTNTSYKWGV